MSEEQRRILEMLSEGKINADEADRLLRIINQSQNTSSGTITESESQHHRGHERVSVIVESDADAEPSHTRDDTFAAGESPKLIVNSENGRIVVNAGDDGEIRVQARLRNPSRIDYQVTQDGDTVRVEARQKGKASLFGFLGLNMGVEITVTTPRNTNVELNSSNGRIELTGVENSGTLETSNGRISMEDVKGDFDAQTQNGTISFSGEFIPGSDNQMKTSNGSVRVKLQGTPSLKIDATTSNGSITNKLPDMAASIEEKNRLVGTIGDGEARLVIQTSNGSVSIE